MTSSFDSSKPIPHTTPFAPETHRRLKLTVEYDGTPFHGWQKQEGLPSVQEQIQKAVKTITGEDVNPYAAGRTDKGVHAKAQVCHFDTGSELELIKFADGISHLAGRYINIVNVEEVTDEFHARFTAINRSYRYRLFARRKMSPLEENRAGHVYYDLDENLMHDSVQVLIGEHDFSAFRSADCQSSTPMVDMQRINVSRDGDIINIDLTANHFLHNMVRILSGTLAEVGGGKRDPQDLQKLITTHKNRQKSGLTLSPSGLYFTHIGYAPHIVIASL